MNSAAHLSHCDQGEYVGSCKYGDPDCPALTQPQVPSGEGEALLPCPFCGSSVEISESESESLFSHDIVPFYSITCPECDVMGQSWEDKGDVVTHWNTRWRLPPPGTVSTLPRQGVDVPEVMAVLTPGAIKLARKVATDIMRGPAETCETRQQFLDGAVPIIAAALDSIITAEAPKDLRTVADVCRAAFDGDDIVQMRLALRKAHDALLARSDAAPDAVGEYVLPCDVRLPPYTTIRKGCRLSTLLAGLKAREGRTPDALDFAPSDLVGALKAIAQMRPGYSHEHRSRSFTTAQEIAAAALARAENREGRTMSDVTCPHCKGGIDIYASELFQFITYWGEDGPKPAHCPKCDAEIFIEEHVTRSWTAGKTADEARHG